ncbi:MAG: FAD-dependent oxidoreductase, partial [Actinomycetota bacterium]
MYDVIVVGARCAGSPTAMLLARKGYRVLLVDRTNFPSDTVSTHAIHNSGVARLKSWGLLDRVVASGCPPVLKYVLHMGPITLAGAPPAADGVAEAHAPRRTVLDAILVEAAAEAGAEVRGGLFVEEILRDKDRAAGIRGRLNGGAVLTEKGRLVVGADGVHSVVARVVGASLYNVQPSLACYYYSYWSGVSLPDFHLHLVESRFLLAVPT